MRRHSHSDKAAAKSFEPPADDADLAGSRGLGAKSAADLWPICGNLRSMFRH